MSSQIYRALVVDDEPMIREAVSRSMSAESFYCDTAADGAEAVEKFRQSRYDLVVTDLRMPGKHGHALIMELLQGESPPHIVVLTGIAEPRLVKDLMDRGVVDVVQKPVNFGLFSAKLSSLFRRKHVNHDANTSENSGSGTSAFGLIGQVEEALELFSMCVPEHVEQLLIAGEDSVTDPPKAQVEFMNRLLAKHAAGSERRNKERFSLLSTAVALPVSKDFVPGGEVFKMTFNDLSETGACFMHTRSINSEYLALRWRSAITPKCSLKAALQITRCKPLGPFYEIAGQFVMHD